MEAWLIPQELKKHHVKCVIGPTYGEKSSEYRHRDPVAGAVLEENAIEFAVSAVMRADSAYGFPAAKDL